MEKIEKKEGMHPFDFMKIAMQEDGSLYFNQMIGSCASKNKFAYWRPGKRTIWMDGCFSLKELQCLAEYMEAEGCLGLED